MKYNMLNPNTEMQLSWNIYRPCSADEPQFFTYINLQQLERLLTMMSRDGTAFRSPRSTRDFPVRGAVAGLRSP
ncbi:hypothetical protein PISMIDRAFT_530068 [Pisolithus microcarpus 441]|uniref:Uncharacterized protein n=1 Tax=Pisolithus microcarpus 441 TaxID=765257 RepID=A0A0C9YZ84_9AGAM|nr:hypothetical protein PISMIDRAFT_530068 [Pisolithus microcarpus 441]